MTVTITLGNVYGEVGPGIGRALAGQTLRYRAKGYQWSDAFRRHQWDGYTKLVNKFGQYPAGLTAMLAEQLEQQGLEVEVKDTRAVPEKAEPLAQAKLLVELEPHQKAAVDAAVTATRGTIWHATAAGKTFTIAGLVHRLSVPTLVLVHRKDLLDQLEEHLQRAMNIPGLIGVIGDGRSEPNWITVGTFQSVYRQLKDYPKGMQAMLDSYGCAIVDEGHHIGAKTFEAVLKQMPNAYYRYAASATPFKEGDDEAFYKVVGWTGPVVSRVTSEEGVEIGRLVGADVLMIETPGPAPDDETYDSALETGILQNIKRNCLTAELARQLSKKGPVLILVERIVHGHRLTKLLCEWQDWKAERHIREAGRLTAVEYIHGKSRRKVRKRALKQFRQGEVDVLVSSVILDEGVDLPNISALIIAGGGKAAHKTLQRVGRGMRAAEGKDKVTVIDFADRGEYLGDHARRRRKVYEAEPAYSFALVTQEEIEEWLT